MFDEIFTRWINTGKLMESDVVPLFLEWNKTFGDGKATPNDVLILLQVVRVDYNSLLNHILKYVGIKKGYDLAEIYDQNGKFIARYWNKKL